MNYHFKIKICSFLLLFFFICYCSKLLCSVARKHKAMVAFSLNVTQFDDASGWRMTLPLWRGYDVKFIASLVTSIYSQWCSFLQTFRQIVRVPNSSIVLNEYPILVSWRMNSFSRPVYQEISIPLEEFPRTWHSCRPFHKEIPHPTKGAEFHTLCRVLNSVPLCIFLTLLHQSEENCFTNIPHPSDLNFL